MASFTYFYSYETFKISGAVMSNDLLYFYSNGSFELTNQRPSNPSFVYSFTKRQLSTITDLMISNFTSATVVSYIGSIVLRFGSDFDISSATCVNSAYNCSIVGNLVALRL